MNSYYDLLKRKHDAPEFLIIVINFDFNENWYRNILRDVNTSALFRRYILIFRIVSALARAKRTFLDI